jgi:bifunctional enzyme CysN/CysC
VAKYRVFADSIGIRDFLAMPISSLAGDNITSASGNTRWYAGPSLMTHLESVVIDGTRS